MASWSQTEVELIVADYFDMLKSELKGEPFNKTEHRQRLSKLLSGRSDGSIERKHQNISAVLIQLGFPYISGYKPLGNFQALLRDVIADRLNGQLSLIEAARFSAENIATAPEVTNILDSEEAPPVSQLRSYRRLKEPIAGYSAGKHANVFDFLSLETRNSSLGIAGEEFVMKFERVRLTQADRADLADRIEQVSKTRGPSEGFDIRSFDFTGADRFIEVKTTSYGKEMPFYITRNELETSVRNEKKYHLYRVFLFRSDPRFFALRGRVDRTCRLDPVQYVGRV